MLHETLKPRGYLEVGVFTGDSLRLVRPGTPAIGIDPAPHLHGHFPGTTRIFTMTSDEFFLQHYVPDFLDLAFIDGMHLYEYALRDFMNIERYSNPRTVVVFDDVLPRNDQEAAREQCPGDWTGDVWKVPRVLEMYRPELDVILVDTQPTGTCVVFSLGQDPNCLRGQGPKLYDTVMTLGLDQWNDVPQEVLDREGAVSPQEVLARISAYLDRLEEQ
jgi:methyltransferase family protein